MSTNNEDVLKAARDLSDLLQSDIQLSRTREEHIRITARANQALLLHNLLQESQAE